MQDPIPRRIVLRLHERYEQEWAAVIDTYFAFSGLDLNDDFYPHLMAPNMSSKMHIVLDLRCKTMSPTDISAMVYEVFKVKKTGKMGVLYVNWLLYVASTNCRTVSSSDSMIMLAASLNGAART